MVKQECSMRQTAAPAAQASRLGLPAALASEVAGTPKVFPAPVQSVYDHYILVQAALTRDSLAGVSAAATAIASAAQGDPLKSLPPKVTQQAQALAKAKDLATARAAFKALSESLIQYFKHQKVPAGSYYVAYCPMARASWLQTNKTILNPYLGQSMLHCGEIQP